MMKRPLLACSCMPRGQSGASPPLVRSSQPCDLACEPASHSQHQPGPGASEWRELGRFLSRRPCPMSDVIVCRASSVIHSKELKRPLCCVQHVRRIRSPQSSQWRLFLVEQSFELCCGESFRALKLCFFSSSCPRIDPHRPPSQKGPCTRPHSSTFGGHTAETGSYCLWDR